MYLYVFVMTYKMTEILQEKIITMAALTPVNMELLDSERQGHSDT